jgi:hypothetical protein
LEKARDQLPKKHSVKVKKVFDDDKGKPKRRLVFEEAVKSKHEHLKGPAVTRPVKAGGNAAVAYPYQACTEPSTVLQCR